MLTLGRVATVFVLLGLILLFSRGFSGLSVWLLISVSIVLSVFIYFIPSFVANSRQHPQKTAIFILNLCLGWTIIGWVGALVWAYIEKTEAAVTSMPSSQAVATDESHNTKACPFCAEDIRAEAIKCKHCGSDLTAPQPS